jgi:hypothetical protein
MSHAEPNVKFEPKPTNSALAKAKERDPTHARPLALHNVSRARHTLSFRVSKTFQNI